MSDMKYEHREYKNTKGKGFALTPWVVGPPYYCDPVWSWRAWLNIKWRLLIGKKVESDDPCDLH